MLEGSLRMYPHLGGTAFGNMLVCLLAFSLLLRWPPHALKSYWGRQAALVVVHTRVSWGEGGENGRSREELVRYVWQRPK